MYASNVMLSAVFALALTGCAAAPNPPSNTAGSPMVAATKTDPVAGMVFVFDDGRVERYLRREGDNLIWATRRGREYIRDANPALPILSWNIGERSGRRAVFGNPSDIWPPREGARARFRVLTEVNNGAESRRYGQAWSCSVGKLRKVSVPAGVFPAYAITCERFSVNSMRLLERRTWWWSEDLGHYVRRHYQDLRSGKVSKFALCGALPELRASEARIEAILDGC